MARLNLYLLGPTRVCQTDGAEANVKYDKVLALLAFLAVEADRAHRRDALAGLLWPELPQQAARNNLRQALLSLREAIGDRDASPPFLLSNRITIQFDGESDYWLDVAAFVAAVQASEQHAHRSAESCLACARRLEQAVALYHGPFLAEFALPDSIAFEEWALLKREWLNGLALRALDRLAIFHERRGHYEQAIAYLQQQLELEPWYEPAHRRLMRLYVLGGSSAAALAQYESCRALLATELGVEPEAETARLYEKIRAAPDGEALVTEHLSHKQDRPYQVPQPPTPFIGREQELEEIGRLVDSSSCRLLTLVGPGGVGKTRLALQAVADQANLFADGIFYINLAAVQNAELLPEAIADGLDLDLGSASPADALLQRLRDKEVLLVLDNAEHLLGQHLPGQTGLIEQLMRRAPSVMFLVTSRERLNLQGEQIFSVEGFAVGPDTGQGAAVQLFVQAAQRARGSFTVSRENRESVIQICQLAGGLPLAIELAAAWTRLLGCAEIATEMERSFHFLTTSWRDLPPRHRSIEAVFDHSYKLLTSEEQGVLAALSLFHDTFSREAAERIAGATLPLLAALVDKSLLQRHPANRYALHPLLRQYAGKRLDEDGKGKVIRNRHLGFFLALAENAEEVFRDAGQKRWLEQLALEQDNLRSALGWAQAQAACEETLEQGVRLAVALYRYWYWRSHFREGVRWLEGFLAHGAFPASLQARALYAAGVLNSELDDYGRAEQFLEASLALRRQLGDEEGQAACLNSLGILAWSQQAYERAKPFLSESLALRRASGASNLGPVLNTLGLVALAQGDYRAAERYFEEQLEEARAKSHEMGLAIGQSNLAVALLEQDRSVVACTHLVAGLEGLHRLGDREGTAGCLETVAAAALHLGDPLAASEICAAAAALRSRLHAPLTPSERPRFERTLAAARSALAPETFLAATTKGQYLSLDQAVTRGIQLCQQVNEGG